MPMALNKSILRCSAIILMRPPSGDRTLVGSLLRQLPPALNRSILSEFQTPWALKKTLPNNGSHDSIGCNH